MYQLSCTHLRRSQAQQRRVLSPDHRALLEVARLHTYRPLIVPCLSPSITYTIIKEINSKEKNQGQEGRSFMRNQQAVTSSKAIGEVIVLLCKTILPICLVFS